MALRTGGTSWVDVAEQGCWLTSFGEDNKEDKERGDLQEINKPKAEDLNQYWDYTKKGYRNKLSYNSSKLCCSLSVNVNTF